jgi:hypothetical protein
METEKASGDDPSGIYQAGKTSAVVSTFRTESTLIFPVKYPALSLVILTAGHLTHSRICESSSVWLKYQQDGLGNFSTRDMHRQHRDHCGPGPERGFPGERARVHRGRGHLVGCHPRACMCGPGRPGCDTLDPPGGVRSAICRIAVSPKAKFEFGDVTATKPLMHPLFSGPRANALQGAAQGGHVPARSRIRFCERIQQARCARGLDL